MNSISILEINNKEYQLIDNTKLSIPDKPGTDGQVLFCNAQGKPYWGELSQETDSLNSPLYVTPLSYCNLFKIKITSCPHNYIAQITATTSTDTTIIFPAIESVISKITYSKEGDDTFINIYLRKQSYSILTYTIYMGYEHSELEVQQLNVTDAPDTIYYVGYIGPTISLTSLEQLNEQTIQTALNIGTISQGSTLDRNTLSIPAPQGAWAVILVPFNYSVLCFNGVNIYSPFLELTVNDNVLSTGGGMTVTIGEQTYYVYGKFLYVAETVRVLIPEIRNTHIQTTTIHGNTLYF